MQCRLGCVRGKANGCARADRPQAKPVPAVRASPLLAQLLVSLNVLTLSAAHQHFETDILYETFSQHEMIFT